MVKRPKAPRKQEPIATGGGSTVASPAEEESSRTIAARIWSASAFLFGALLVWSFLVPLDATSVFQGEALPQNLLWLVLAVLIAVAAAWSGGRIEFKMQDWLVTLFCLAWLILVAVLAGRENNPRIAWNGFWQCVALASCYMCAKTLAVAPRTRAAALLIGLVGCLALAGHGIHQVTVSIPRDRIAYHETPDELLRKYQIDAPAGSPRRKLFEDRLNSPEPFATFALANSLATILSAGLILVAGLIVSSWKAGRAGSPAAWPLLASLAIALSVMLICWFLTRSRTAYVAVLVALGYWAASSWLAGRGRGLSGNGRGRPSKQLGYGGGIVVALGAAGLVWLFRNDRLVLLEAPKSIAYRLEYWIATLALLRDHGLFGVGLGNFQSYYPRYKLEIASETIADPHNWPLDIAATLSIPIALVVVLWIAKNLFRSGLAAHADERAPAGFPLSGLAVWDQSLSLSLLRGAALGGVVCGVLVALLTGLDLEATLIGWIAAAIIGLLLWPAVQTLAEEGSRCCRSAAVAIVVCLLASGSWQASGIAVPLLVLLAVSDPARRSTRPPASRLRVWGVIALPLLGLASFAIQSWQPVTTGWAQIQQAQRARSLQERLSLTEAAIEADPLDTAPIGSLAQTRVMMAELSPPELFSRRATEASATLERWLAADSAKHLNWQIAGDFMLDLAAAADRRGLAPQPWLEKSASLYSEAVRRYPSSVQLRVQLASASALLGRGAACREQLQQAWRLSEQTPHADKKLESQLIWLPFLPEGAELPYNNSRWVPAEPLANWLRKNAG